MSSIDADYFFIFYFFIFLFFYIFFLFFIFILFLFYFFYYFFYLIIIFVFPSLFSRWFCHFDDDNYVNVHTLVKTLKKFNPLENVYLGRPSLTKAMEVMVMIRWDRFRMHSRLRYPWSESTLEYGPSVFICSQTCVHLESWIWIFPSNFYSS